MDKSARIYVAGHRGLVGSAIVRELERQGYANLIFRTSQALDLRDGAATDAFFAAERPAYVFLAAAKVGGILANQRYPVEFLSDNLAIQSSVIHAAYRHRVERLLFLGSSCIYPKLAPQPLKEEYLLTGPLEPTNRAYAIAKIAGIELCSAYNRQYGTKYLAAMPTNLYGPGDNYHPEHSHVLPALIRKFHEAKVNGSPSVTLWGTGTPRREFLYSDDMASACVYLANLDQGRFDGLVRGEADSAKAAPDSLAFHAPLINIGVGEDLRISELAVLVAKIVGFGGSIDCDPTKPDGTPRKILDVTRLNALGWVARTPIDVGIEKVYRDFLSGSRL